VLNNFVPWSYPPDEIVAVQVDAAPRTRTANSASNFLHPMGPTMVQKPPTMLIVVPSPKLTRMFNPREVRSSAMAGCRTPRRTLGGTRMMKTSTPASEIICSAIVKTHGTPE